MFRSQRIATWVAAAGLIAGPIIPALAQGASAQKNETKGQGQLAGSNGQFGVIYTLKNGFNFAILKAQYTLDPFVAYAPITAGTDTKVFVMDIAVKNVKKDDNFFNPESLFTLVDSKGELYPGGSLALTSKSDTEGSFTLKPGQGLGQADLKDPLRIAWAIPAKARIVKIMVNQGRAGKSEDVMRYYVAGATKEEAGMAGDPKNIVAPLPEIARDPADKSGAVALDEGKGTIGTYVPSGSFGLKLESFAFTTEALNGGPPEEGKKFAVATITAKNLSHKNLTFFDVSGGDSPLYEIADSDGEREKPVVMRKAKRDEDPDHEFKPGDEYTYRVVFVLPKDTTAKKLVIGTGGARKWAFDVSNVK